MKFSGDFPMPNPLENLQTIRTGNSLTEAKQVRTRFENFFINEGSEEWQDAAIENGYTA